MFDGNTGFNRGLGGWDVGSVIDMANMFDGATSLVTNLTGWSVPSIGSDPGSFANNAPGVVSPIWGSTQTPMIMIYSNTTSAYTYVFSPDEDDMPPDAIIDWGDGSIELLNQNRNILNHFYTSSGTHTVTIRGYLPKIQGGAVGFGFTPPPGTSGLTAVTEWNSTTVSLRAAFEGRNALISVPNYLPPLVTDIDFMFLDAASINDPNIALWDVSNVTSMFGTFYNSLGFNQDLSNWCVSGFPSEPSEFSQGATSWTQPKPVWGTCP
jgi:hypothetical protein